MFTPIPKHWMIWSFADMVKSFGDTDEPSVVSTGLVIARFADCTRIKNFPLLHFRFSFLPF
jgi:hypothetical protein